MHRRKLSATWTSKRRNVEKLVMEGGWAQKWLDDVGWSDEEMCRGCGMEEGTEKHRLYHSAGWARCLAS